MKVTGRRAVLIVAALVAAGAVGSCRTDRRQPASRSVVDQAAHEYVALVNALIAHDPDSASGDTAMPEPNTVTSSAPPTLQAIADRARDVAGPLESLQDRSEHVRIDWLVAQLDAIAARATLVAGRRLPVDEELGRMYGIRWSPSASASLEPVRAELDRLLPGTGPLPSRLRAFDERLAVPADRLPAVFDRAMQECRDRTIAHVTLPAGERVSVRYVTGRPWSGFSRYLGDAKSIVEVNTGFALTLDRVVDLACHESYPGHHVLNVLRDERRASLGWEELGAVPLFSPESFDAEVRATGASSLVFTDAERIAFVRDVLAPLAGVSGSDAAAHVRVGRLVARLGPAITDAVARYLAQDRDYVETLWALQRDALMEQPQPTLAFVHQFRGFALAYTWTVREPQGTAAAADAGEVAWTSGAGARHVLSGKDPE